MTTTIPSRLTDDPELKALLWGEQWLLGETRVLTYSFPGLESIWDGAYAAGSEPAIGFAALDATAQAAVRRALSAWASVANVEFQEVADDANGSGILRFAYTGWAMGSQDIAYAYLPEAGSSGGDVWLNAGLRESFFSSFTPAGLPSFVLLHEIGHAIGLKHPGTASGLNDTTLDAHQDSIFETVMSYQAWPGVPLTGENLDRLPTTPMALDIDAIQALYGANATHRASDDVYSYESAGRYLETLYDTGGHDTIQVSGTRDVEIDLRPDEWSRIGIPVQINGGAIQIADTVRIHRGTLIEDAIGGDGNDTLVGNDLDNLLIGNGGNDTLSGGPGTDTLIGGAGADVFRLDAGGADLIVDFSAEDGDWIEFDQLLVGFSGYAQYSDPFATGFLALAQDGDDVLLLADGDGSLNGSDYQYVARIDGTTTAALHDLAYMDGIGAGGSALEFSLAGVTSNAAPTFSIGSGKVTTAIGPGDDSSWDAAQQGDGKIVLAGKSWNGVDDDFALARYNLDGSLDTTFSGDGRVTTSIGSGDDLIGRIVIQSDGKIVVAGDMWNGSHNEFALARYNPDGTLDTSFDGDGMRTVAFTDSIGGATDAWAYAIALAPDGDIIAAGEVLNVSRYDFALVRINASDGSLDTAFDGDGRLTTSFGATSAANDVVVQSDGKIVAVGAAADPVNGDWEFALARYQSNGALDTTFSGDGMQTTPLSSTRDDVAMGAALRDGKIFVAGYAEYTSSPYDQDFAVAAYNANGTLDTTFSGDGLQTTPFSTTDDDAAFDIALQADGKILAGGWVWNGSNYDFALVRYSTTGLLDLTFSGGTLTTAIGTGNDRGTALLTLADGRILLAGESHNGTDLDFALVRYNSDGSLDPSFGGTSTLDATSFFVEDGSPVVLDANAQVYDPELGVAGNYASATLTLARHGGANAADEFVASGSLSALTQGGTLTVSGIGIGTVTQNSGGTLVLTFSGASATGARVNSALQGIAYRNVSDTPPASVQIDWTFSDGNTGTQGTGGASTATGSTTTAILATDDAATTFRGTALADDLDGTALADRLYGLAGDDLLTGFGGDDLLDGADGADDLYGGPGRDTLVGGTGDDSLTGNAGDDSMLGGDGADFLTRYMGDGNDTMTGGAGSDLFYLYPSRIHSGASEVVLIEGGDDDDYIITEILDSAAVAMGSVLVTGGAGSDIYLFGYAFVAGGGEDLVIPELTDVSLPVITVNDFAAGAGGDRIALSPLLEISSSWVNGYAGGNPFAPALGYLRLIQSGPDTLLQWDIDGAVNPAHGFQTVMTLKNVTATSLTAANFNEGVDPAGGPVAPQTLSAGLNNTTNDTLAAGLGNDTILGYGGNDDLIGFAGNDSLDGGSGDDYLVGWAGNDTLVGGSGSDRLLGDRGDDLLLGGNDDDTIKHGAGEGNDTIYGGLGDDYFEIRSGSLGGPTETVRVYGDDGLDQFWVSIVGAPNTGTIVATGGAGVDGYFFYSDAGGIQAGLTITDFTAGAGGDMLFLDTLMDISASGSNGYAGGNPMNGTLAYLRVIQSAADTLLQWDRDGLAGNAAAFETVIVLQGLTATSLTSNNFGENFSPDGVQAPGESITGTTGNDTRSGTYADDTISGLGGDDLLYGYSGADLINGGDGHDTLNGGAGSDTLFGGLGDDKLSGNLGADSVDGGGGDDTLVFALGDGNDTLNGADGADSFLFTNDPTYVLLPHVGMGETVRVFGGSGDDMVALDVGVDWNGEDILASGETGRDTYLYYYSSIDDKADGTVAMPLLTITDFATGVGGDLFDLETLLEISSSETGGYAGGSPFSLGQLRFQQSGSDTLLQWDRDGAQGLTYGFATLIVLQGVSSSAIDANSFKAEVLTGSDADDLLIGGLGVDTLNGGKGNDILDGNWGADSMAGGVGDDVYYVDDSDDIVIEENNTLAFTLPGALPGYEGDPDGIEHFFDLSVYKGASDTVKATANYSLAPFLENLILLGDGDLVGTGNELRNGIVGNDGANTLSGLAADDTIFGGLGNDSLDGGLGLDTALYSGAKASYTVTKVGAGYTVTDTSTGDGDEGLDTLTSIEWLQFTDGAQRLGLTGRDYNGDGNSDLFWRNSTTGETSLWLMNGTQIGSAGGFGNIASAWQVVEAKGDYNGDGNSDLFWRNSTTGETSLWLMNGTQIGSAGGFGNIASAWQVVEAKGDYNGDGNSDLFWRNSSTGETSLWLMNGTQIGSAGGFGNIASAWQVVEAKGDYNGDGNSDLFWRNSTTGETSLWLMNGTQIGSAGGFGNIASAWQVVEAKGDYNGDGNSDLFWRNSSTGETSLWLMNGTQIGSAGGFGNIASAWQVVEAKGDYNGDGNSDLFWRNSTTGETSLWLMNGTQIGSAGGFGNIASAWQVVEAKGDYNGDGNSDLFWRNSTTGETSLWLMNGTQIGSAGGFGNVAPEWGVVS